MKIKQIIKEARVPGVITDLAPTLRVLITNLPAPQALDAIQAEIDRYFAEQTWSIEKDEWEQRMSLDQKRAFAQKLLLSLSKHKKAIVPPQENEESTVAKPATKPARPYNPNSSTIEYEIVNPKFNEDDPNSEYYINVEVEYTISGWYHPSTWGYHGGDPAEYPEVEIVGIYNKETGEDVEVTPQEREDIIDLIYKRNEDRMTMSKGSFTKRYREEP